MPAGHLYREWIDFYTTGWCDAVETSPFPDIFPKKFTLIKG